MIGMSSRSIAIARSATSKRAGLAVLSWLTGPQASAPVASQSQWSAPFRKSHREVAGRWLSSGLSRDQAAQYYSRVATLNGRGASTPYPRVADWPLLREALDHAIAATIRDGVAPEEALNTAAKTWDQHVANWTDGQKSQWLSELRQSTP